MTTTQKFLFAPWRFTLFLLSFFSLFFSFLFFAVLKKNQKKLSSRLGENAGVCVLPKPDPDPITLTLNLNLNPTVFVGPTSPRLFVRFFFEPDAPGFSS